MDVNLYDYIIFSDDNEYHLVQEITVLIRNLVQSIGLKGVESQLFAKPP